MGCLCSKPSDDSPGDKAFDTGIEAYSQYKALQPSQRSSADAQALLTKAIDSFYFAINYYRKTNDQNLGAVLVNLAALKWDLYRAVNEVVSVNGEKVSPAGSAKQLEEVIKLDEEALGIWQVRDPKPITYPTLLANLAGAYRERFVKNRQTAAADVQQALRLYMEAREYTEKIDSRAHVEATMQIGVTYWTWYYDPSNATTGTVDRMDSAIRNLMDAQALCQDQYPDIRSTCLYNLAWINHHRFDKQEGLQQAQTPNPDSDYLSEAIHFYTCTLKSMHPNDPRYAKALWFLPMLLFHRYEGNRRDQDLQDAQKWAREALNSRGITDEEHLQQLKVVRDFDAGASPETTRGVRKAVRRSTMTSFRSESAEYDMQSAVMPSILEVGAQEKGGDQVGFPGAGTITSEPEAI